MTRPARDGARTQARIEAEALKLFADKGIDGTSMRDIAEAVGVSEGALYRHFQGKAAMARGLYLDGYAALAGTVIAAGEGLSFAAATHAVVSLFCRLFDEDRARFTFLILAQHAHLSEAPPDRTRNVAEAVKTLFSDAMARGEIPRSDADELAAMAIGIVAQPATFTLYGRLSGPLGDRAPAMTRAILAMALAAGEGDHAAL